MTGFVLPVIQDSGGNTLPISVPVNVVTEYFHR